MSAARVRKDTDVEGSKAYNTAQNKVTEVDAGSHCFKDIYHSQIKEAKESNENREAAGGDGLAK